jgi:AraC-like DNA-binding protein
MKSYEMNLEVRMEGFWYVMSGIENLYAWRYVLGREGLELRESNCRDVEFWHNIFMSQFSERILTFLKKSGKSVLLGDDLGITWIATPRWEYEYLQEIWLLGPMFSSDMRESDMNHLLDGKQISVAYKRELTRQLGKLPNISHSMFCLLGTMQHFCVTNTRIREMDLEMMGLHEPSLDVKEEKEMRKHGGTEHEALMLKAIREGNLHYGNETREQNYIVPGTLAHGDAIRQFKNEIITAITLCSRAAIEGGMSREMSLTLSDKYIQAVEAAKTVPEVAAMHLRMRKEYIQRVHDLKRESGLSPAVISCMDYIELHITSRLAVVDVAGSTGYSGYYISRLFQKQTGQSLSDYIQKKKIEHASFLLKNSGMSVRDIAAELHYSSPSHFCTLFRREMGMTPTQYRGKNDEYIVVEF